MRIRNFLLACFAVASVSLALGACSSAGGGSADDTLADPQLEEGRKLFATDCAACHGANGEGGVGPKLAGNVKKRYPNIADQEAVILNGRGNMPAFKEKLTPEQVTAVAMYEREVL